MRELNALDFALLLMDTLATVRDVLDDYLSLIDEHEVSGGPEFEAHVQRAYTLRRRIAELSGELD